MLVSVNRHAIGVVPIFAWHRRMLFLRKKTTFREVAEKVLSAKVLKSEATQTAAKFWIPRLIENFGEIPVSELTEDHWTEYIVREKGKRARKFFDDRKYMRQCLKYAARNGIVKKPIELPIPDPPWDAGKEIRDHELRMLEHNAGPTLRFQIRIGWKMGLRLREMLNLRWAQIDIDRGIVTLASADTKTRKGRKVPIPSDLLPEFSARFVLAASEFVFPGRGTGAAQTTNKKAWELCKKLSGVRARWHDLRHTCATLLLRKGIPSHVVEDYLGMSSKVLNKVYAHADIDDLKAAAESLSKAEGGSK